MEVIGSIYTEVSDDFQKGIIGGYFKMCKGRKTRFRSCFNGRSQSNRSNG